MKGVIAGLCRPTQTQNEPKNCHIHCLILKKEMDVYELLIATFAIAFVLPIARWLHIHYISFLLRNCFQAAAQMKKKLEARKSTFQQEVDKIAAQYGVSSSSKELHV